MIKERARTAAGLGLDDLQREHFEVSSLRPVIDEIRHQIDGGRGFVVVRACRSRTTQKKRSA